MADMRLKAAIPGPIPMELWPEVPVERDEHTSIGKRLCRARFLENEAFFTSYSGHAKDAAQAVVKAREIDVRSVCRPVQGADETPCPIFR